MFKFYEMLRKVQENYINFSICSKYEGTIYTINILFSKKILIFIYVKNQQILTLSKCAKNELENKKEVNIY